jgi:hypothetical protein
MMSRARLPVGRDGVATAAFQRPTGFRNMGAHAMKVKFLSPRLQRLARPIVRDVARRERPGPTPSHTCRVVVRHARAAPAQQVSPALSRSRRAKRHAAVASPATNVEQLRLELEQTRNALGMKPGETLQSWRRRMARGG